jgi:hypothetical protein
MKNTNLTAFGQHGYKVITTTDATTPTDGYNFVAVTAIADSTSLTTATSDTDRFPNMATQSIPTGVTVYGSWNSITLGGGAVIAYMA